MSKPLSKSARLHVEALGDRLVPSVTFQEDTAAHSLTLTAGQNQNNTITVRNDGDGGLRITADGVTRNFTGITRLDVKTGNGADTVTYNQGTDTQEVDVRRDFTMNVWLGDNAAGTTDRFTANVFGDVGFSQAGALQERKLGFIVKGEGGRDRIDINANHDTDVRAGSQLFLRLNGQDGNDNITVDYDGELDGRLDMLAHGLGGNDTIAAVVQLDAGSSGQLLGTDDADYGKSAVLTGDLGDDTLRFAVRLAAGATAEVEAVVDGGFGFGWPDNDVGRHTTNVRTAWLEQDIVIQ